jgi:type IV pilus assembly protein PilC
MDYVYKAKDRGGKVQEAVAQASSPNELRAKLQSKGLTVVEIKPKGAGGAGAKDPIQEFSDKFEAMFEKVELKDMVIFSRQFASMIGAGVAMLRALTIMVDQCENKKLKGVLDDVRRGVESGATLSDAFGRHPDIFDKLFVSMVKAGEAGGILDEVMNRVAEFTEAKSKLNQKVGSAMAYPSAVLAVAVIVFWAMLTFILPIFQNMFKGMGAELPAFTGMLIAMSEFMRSFWMLVFVVAVGTAVWGIKKWYKTETGKYRIDAFLLKVPVMGELIKKVSIARFTRTFGTLIHSGVPMLTALEVVKDTAGNAVFSKSVAAIQSEVTKGETISKQCLKDPLIPAMVAQMVAVGEETGRLDEMLDKIADFYDTEVENSVEAVTSLLEPIMVVGIGGIVGSVVVGMYLPIFSIINQVH